MLYAIAAVVALIADQALKYWITANIEVETGARELIPGFIRLTHIHNSGAAFSFLQGARWLFVVLCVVFVLVVVWLLVKRIIATPGARWAAVFVLAGAIGNCIDRILNGYVVDMLEFEFVRFPVFNLADIFITVGALVFCVCLLVEKPVVVENNVVAAGAPKPAADAAAAPRKAKNSGYVRTPYVAPTPAPRRPEPPPFDPTNPFAEWETKRETPAQPEAAPRPSASAMPVEHFELNDILSEFDEK